MDTKIKQLDTKPQYKKDRVLYIIQSAVEYFITIMVGGAYIAKVGIEIGMSDSMIAIISSMLQFSYAFQLVAMFFAGFKHPKRWITPMLLTIQVCFCFVYVIPIVPLPDGIRPFILAALVVVGYAFYNITVVAKSSWMIGFVADDKRGNFAAVCQIISLISGMIVSYTLGKIIDIYEAQGNLRGSFIVMGIILAAFAVIQVALFLFTKEIPNEASAGMSLGAQLKSILQNRGLLKIFPIYIIYYAAQMSALPFYSTYQVKELGFSMTFVAVLSALTAISRSVASVFLGKYGDRRGFVKTLNIAFIFAAAAYFINIFTVPKNGMVFYTVYTVLNAVTAAGIGVADSNIIFEYATPSTRVGALAIKGTLAGAVGFLTTLAATPLVNKIQANGNKIFGMNIYAQQFMSAIAFVGVILLLIYINTVAKNAKSSGKN